MHRHIFFLIAIVTLLPAQGTLFAQSGQRYEVTITNLTRGQQFTPILVASHRPGVRLFTLGSPASAELATLAEEGNTSPLSGVLSSLPDVKAVTTTAGLLNPGRSVTVTIEGGGSFTHVSVGAMLIPTNDAFFAANGVEVPAGLETLTLFSPAYDAGSERNDELCTSIPGPSFSECNGPGGGARVGGGEGFVHIHAGIQGTGTFIRANRDWRNPVAQITMRRVPSSLILSNLSSAARVSGLVAGDSWSLQLSDAPGDSPVQLHIWRNGQDLGISGPHGARTDAQGRWLHRGSVTDSEIGTWQLQAIVGSPDSRDVSRVISFTVVR